MSVGSYFTRRSEFTCNQGYLNISLNLASFESFFICLSNNNLWGSCICKMTSTSEKWVRCQISLPLKHGLFICWYWLCCPVLLGHRLNSTWLATPADCTEWKGRKRCWECYADCWITNSFWWGLVTIEELNISWHDSTASGNPTCICMNGFIC